MGINAVEFLPIFEFDENEDVINDTIRYDSKGNRLLNYWGYNPISFLRLKQAMLLVENTPCKIMNLKSN